MNDMMKLQTKVTLHIVMTSFAVNVGFILLIGSEWMQKKKIVTNTNLISVLTAVQR